MLGQSRLRLRVSGKCAAVWERPLRKVVDADLRLKAAHVPVELHSYAQGGHAYGICGGYADAVAGVSQDGRTTAVCGRLLDGEKMAVLCQEFEISRKAGYKIFRLQRLWGRRADGPLTPAVPPCAPAAFPDSCANSSEPERTGGCLDSGAMVAPGAESNHRHADFQPGRRLRSLFGADAQHLNYGVQLIQSRL